MRPDKAKRLRAPDHREEPWTVRPLSDETVQEFELDLEKRFDELSNNTDKP